MSDRPSLPRFCLGCSYCLTGVNDACPECGRPFSHDDPATYRTDRPLSNRSRRIRAFVVGMGLSQLMLTMGMCFVFGIPGNAPAPWFIVVPLYILAPGIMFGSALGPMGPILLQLMPMGLIVVAIVEWVHRRNPEGADRFCRRMVPIFLKK